MEWTYLFYKLPMERVYEVYAIGVWLYYSHDNL